MPSAPDWRSASAYAHAYEYDLREFAWEYLRRNPSYQEDYRAAVRSAERRRVERSAVRWGLRSERGACVFLGPSGCSLGAEARPTACLLYPFEPTEHGWTLAVERSGSPELAARSGEPRCLAVEEARSRGGLLRDFALDVQGLTALIERLRSEVETHPEPASSVKSRSTSFVAEVAERDRSSRLRRPRLR